MTLKKIQGLIERFKKSLHKNISTKERTKSIIEQI